MLHLSPPAHVLALGVPPLSEEGYRLVNEVAWQLPSWTHSAAEIGTDAGVVALLGVLIVTWWSARTRSTRTMALALSAPAAAVLAYLASELLKIVVDEQRPCRSVPGTAALVACPPPGDWSFPSNHATLAAAAAAAAALAAGSRWRRVAALTVPVAMVVGFSRVLVGAHYPHDVVAGFLLGMLLTPALGLVIAGLLAPRVPRLRRAPVLARFLGAPPPAAPERSLEPYG